jgi:cytochrome bd-type quinol oxidase subunit 2
MVNKNKLYKYSMALAICCVLLASILEIMLSIHYVMEKQMIYEYPLIFYIVVLIFTIFIVIYLFIKRHKQIIKNKN